MEVSLFSIYLVLSVLVLVIALITCGFIYLTFIAGMTNVTMEVLFCLTMTIHGEVFFTHTYFSSRSVQELLWSLRMIALRVTRKQKAVIIPWYSVSSQIDECDGEDTSHLLEATGADESSRFKSGIFSVYRQLVTRRGDCCSQNFNQVSYK